VLFHISLLQLINFEVIKSKLSHYKEKALAIYEDVSEKYENMKNQLKCFLLLQIFVCLAV